MRYPVRELLADTLPLSSAMDLVWRVFQAYEAPDYSETGIAEFRQCIQSAAMQTRMRPTVAWV